MTIFMTLLTVIIIYLVIVAVGEWGRLGLISYIDNLLFKITEDETEKWLRFHDDLDKRYATGGLQDRPRILSPTPIVEISETEKLLNPNYIPKIKSLEVTRKEKIFHLIKVGKISTERAEELLDQIDKPEELNHMESPKKTNSFNNQFILQSNSSTQKSSYQCVVCGSFNVSLGVAYTDWHVAKKTITCGDCNNKFSKKEWIDMTYYLDKENNILFVKPNSKVKLHVMQDVAKAFEKSVIPYKVIILDHEDELVII